MEDKEHLYGHLISKTSRALMRYLTMHFKEDDITPEQWTVLKRLGEQDGITQKELALLADKDQATLTKILDILERKQLVRRGRNMDDRRSFLIFITDEGRRLRERLFTYVNRLFEEEIVAGIPEEDLRVFLATLMKIQQHAESAKET
ncbi:MarR family winged helix-turn-helix transcriptional regulator [Paenibacillus chibensis]|uniref:MarR family winged helix-turn-helix transcriptional regulator n=1 Tax=Paenibacillus chibensis TaxID=59846 RepID=UPI000FDC9FA8|nr:MarR family transcriptional regulator [Paenibacillus chibensis]MEC0370978.1 MarR family transcriptional regulator [Paenibacillus chibensis]